MSQVQRIRFAIAAAKVLGIIAVSALLTAPLADLAQPGDRVLRIGVVEDTSEKTRVHHWQAFRARLRELGYVEGRNLVIEARYARGVADRFPALAAEIVALRPDIIVATSTPATQAAMKATSTIPIIFTGIADPVASGLVGSLARPGGNTTGLSIITTEIGGKWVELLRELAPGGKRFAYLTDTTNPGAVLVFNRLRDHARVLDVTVEMFEGKLSGLERSLDAIARERFAGLIVGSPSILFDGQERIIKFAAQQKLPAVYASRRYADAGGLLSYAMDPIVLYRRTAEYVYRISQGAKPSEMPVERPSTVRMVLNLKTSRALGIPIPPSIRHRADELID